VRPFTLSTLLVALIACGGNSGPRASVPAGFRAPSHPGDHRPPGSPAHPFLVKPYLQMGDAPAGFDQLTLVWHAAENLSDWKVETRSGAGAPWTPMAAPSAVRVAIRGGRIPLDPYQVWSTVLTPLVPGATFQYRVLAGGQEVFPPAEARARRAPGQSQRVVVVGDLATGTGNDRAVARQIDAQHPDLLVGVGDLVYPDGTAEEYRNRFFPVYNDGSGVRAGLMGRTLMVGALGNHDVGHAGRRRPPLPDSLAYFYTWYQPCNGPDLEAGGHLPNLQRGAACNWFGAAPRDRFPHMANFTFRSGDVHWTVLDSNRYIHWGERDVRAWLERELGAAQDATWRFVVFHHPGFNLSTTHHTGDWHMRELWPLFQRYHVDLVFTGHLHAYQRTRPMAFTPVPAGARPATHYASDANILVDTGFDGRTRTEARFPIQIITGGGGGDLHHLSMPTTPKPYHAAVHLQHGFSLLEIDGRRLEFKQVNLGGAVLDAFTLTK
jgi:hypothetical protein